MQSPKSNAFPKVAISTYSIIFVLGWPFEWTEILIIFVPIFLPLVEFFGVNPYFFAMLIVTGFNEDDLYSAYVKKDKIIRDRLKSGY